MSRITVIGLGSMGRPIARNLLRAGREVTVWNRSPEPVRAIAADGARIADRIEQVWGSGVVLSMLSDDHAVAETIIDSGMLDAAPAGAVHVNLATVSPELARRAAAEHATRGVGYLAAPVFGRVAVAEAGNLNILAAGDPILIERVQPFFDVIGARTWNLGENPEQANVVKILGNYLISCVIQSLGEAIGVAERFAVDSATLVDLLTTTLFPGPVYTGYGAMIGERRYQPAGFTTQLGRKDVHLALDAAQIGGVALPFGEILREVFDRAILEGRAADDWASIAELQR
jgi:3-hydroxyisobutyrate dehydrogenase-like beta-hydroxyacid dehydrogenase